MIFITVLVLNCLKYYRDSAGVTTVAAVQARNRIYSFDKLIGCEISNEITRNLTIICWNKKERKEMNNEQWRKKVMNFLQHLYLTFHWKIMPWQCIMYRRNNRICINQLGASLFIIHLYLSRLIYNDFFLVDFIVHTRINQSFEYCAKPPRKAADEKLNGATVTERGRKKKVRSLPHGFCLSRQCLFSTIAQRFESD